MFHVKQWRAGLEAVPAGSASGGRPVGVGRWGRPVGSAGRPPTVGFDLDRSRPYIPGHAGFRRHRGGRRSCGLRGGRRGRAPGRAHPAAHPQDRDHRGDVLQPGHRRPGQGPPGARDRRPRRPDGPGHRPRRHPVPRAQPKQGPGGARAARPGRPQALPPRHAGAAARPAGPRDPGRGGGGSGGRPGRPLPGRDRCRRPVDRGRRRGAHRRHLPTRRDPHRRGDHGGRARRRGARARLVAQARADRLPPRPPEDRDAAAPGRPDHRLRRPPGPARGRPAAAVLDPDRTDHAAAGRVPRHLHHAGRARPDPRQPAPGAHVLRPDRERRPALLPLDRGQGGALRRSRAPSDLPGARGAGRPDGLPQRHLHLAAA